MNSNQSLRFPRTSGEAFKGADYAQAVEWTPPPKFRLWRNVFIAATAALGVAVVALGCAE